MSDETSSITVLLDQDVAVTSNLELPSLTFSLSGMFSITLQHRTDCSITQNSLKPQETGMFYVFFGNPTSNAHLVKCGNILGTAAPVRAAYHAVPQCDQAHKEERDKKLESPSELLIKIYYAIDLRSESKFSSSSDVEFLSSRDQSEKGLSEREIRKHTTLIYWPLFHYQSLRWKRCKSCGDKLPAIV